METATTGLRPGTLVTIKEVQATLSCCAAKAWALVRDGHLTRIKFGTRMTRFKSDEVITLIERGLQ